MNIYICGSTFFDKLSPEKWKKHLGEVAETTDRLNFVLFEDLLYHYYIQGQKAAALAIPEDIKMDPVKTKLYCQNFAYALSLIFTHMTDEIYKCPVLIDFAFKSELISIQDLSADKKNMLRLYFHNRIADQTDPNIVELGNHYMHFHRSMARIYLYCGTKGINADYNIYILSAIFKQENILRTINNINHIDPS